MPNFPLLLTRRRQRRFASSRGMVLVLVLWISALLTLLAGSFSHSMRIESRLGQTITDNTRAQAIAEAGLHYLLLRLFAMNPLQPEAVLNIAGSGGDNPLGEFADQVLPLDGSPYPWRFEDVEMTLHVQDTSGLIDLNRASQPLMKGLFLSVGLSEEDAEILFQRIQDWRDPDEEPQFLGAEIDAYLAEGLPPPKNADFETLDELRLVLGMRPELLEQLRPALTVHSRQPGFNPLTAQAPVLRAIPNLSDPRLVDEYLALRQAARDAGLPLPGFPEAGPYAMNGVNGSYHLRVIATLEHGGQRQITTVAAGPNRAERFFTLFNYRTGGVESWR